MSGVDIFSVTVMVIAFLGVFVLVYVSFRGNRGHEGEDEARRFFDEHGRWPDEPEEAAVRRPGGYRGVDDLPGRE